MMIKNRYHVDCSSVPRQLFWSFLERSVEVKDAMNTALLLCHIKVIKKIVVVHTHVLAFV